MLAVVTWNLHAGEGDLGRFLDDLTAGAITRTPIRDYVVLLQEAIVAADADPRVLVGQRALSVQFTPVRESDGRRSGNAIVSTLPLTDVRTIALPRQRQPRSALFAHATIDGVPFFIVCAHLENRISLLRGGLFSDSARGRQADALLQALPPEGFGIAGGDFNTWLGANEPAWRAFLARFDDTPGPPFEPTFRDRLVLDHLFFDVPDGWQVGRLVVRERYGSDHHPVIGLVARAR